MCFMDESFDDKLVAVCAVCVKDDEKAYYELKRVMECSCCPEKARHWFKCSSFDPQRAIGWLLYFCERGAYVPHKLGETKRKLAEKIISRVYSSVRPTEMVLDDGLIIGNFEEFVREVKRRYKVECKIREAAGKRVLCKCKRRKKLKRWGIELADLISNLYREGVMRG
ncbi:hypothetical protein IPA_02050 [Ignicoccus pacificus DSM 13166]|uniref:Uncharacterized protein n=1 Tax=Ignicoccus pacificus DSM 13166 TaxID=940294 RepID=A0A977KAL8_9CREN|nr:hypothetical protein IPA_02050 [Ignicoccus pacificus DSM 13166]